MWFFSSNFRVYLKLKNMKNKKRIVSMEINKVASKAKAAQVFVLMGVSGSGKTTVGQGLARQLNCPFYDGDDFHPPENIARMSRGIPLTDEDRWPWLERLQALIAQHLQQGQTAVLTCSALKRKYRERLRTGNDGIVLIYLKGTFDLIWQRMQHREGHYMKAEMLQSQFDTLEEPSAAEAHIVLIDQKLEAIVQAIVEIVCSGR
jgi:gluconokinase